MKGPEDTPFMGVGFDEDSKMVYGAMSTGIVLAFRLQDEADTTDTASKSRKRKADSHRYYLSYMFYSIVLLVSLVSFVFLV